MSMMHGPGCMCIYCVEERQRAGLFSRMLRDGSLISGVKGGATHFHDYDNLGIGHIKIHSTGEKIPVNNFNATVESLLPECMKKRKP